MKRLPRNNENFDVLDLFDKFSRLYNYSLNDPSSVEDFLKHINNSINESKDNDILIYGKRTEALFSFMAGAMGKAQLIKQEDTGAIYSEDVTLKVPDFRIILKDGSSFLVEVKNYHGALKDYKINYNYLQKLENYSKLNKLSLKIAIYYSQMNVWALIPSDYFSSNTVSISIGKSLSISEMNILGDCMIATIPNLEIEFLPTMKNTFPIDKDGKTNFKIGRVKFYCNNNEILNAVERRLCFQFLRYGTWVEQKDEAYVDDGYFNGMKISFAPRNKDDKNEFQTIGYLSSMISSAFKELTVVNGEVNSIDTIVEPTALSINIPEDYKGEILPIWRFIIIPNDNAI